MDAAACAYLSSALDTMQTYALMRDSVDWSVVRTNAFERASAAEDIRETYPAIEEALRALGDNHSFFMPPDEVRDLEQAADYSLPDGRILDGYLGGVRVAYVTLPPFSRIDAESSREYADSAQDLIWGLRHSDPCGWIVNLRGNTGGNMWPMLAGIGPLLGEGHVGVVIGPDLELRWTYEDGSAKLEDNILAEVPEPIEAALPSETPVAVLTSMATASSGEAVAIAFRERPNTQSFGQPTVGLPTGNAPFELADGARLILTTTHMADRTGRIYHGAIEPDSVVEGSDALEVAAEWLASTASCQHESD